MFHLLSRAIQFLLSPIHQEARFRYRARQVRLALEHLENRLVPSTFYVAGLGDTGQGMTNEGDLRYCINQVNKSTDASNTIVFPGQLGGTIMLTGELPIISKNVTIQGSTSSAVTIQGKGSAANPYRDFAIGTNVTAEIDNLTIQGGYITTGGGAGILNDGDLTLKNDTITGNTASQSGGGGVYNGAESQLYVIGGLIQYNDATEGGGILNYGWLLGDSGLIILANNATNGSGGGVYNLGTAHFEDSTNINGNSATQNGGGVYNDATATFIMDGGTIGINNAIKGAGLFNAGIATLDSGLMFQENTATQQGGGLYLASGSTTNVDTITVQGNEASAGPGIYKQNGAYLDPISLTDSDDPNGDPVTGS